MSGKLDQSLDDILKGRRKPGARRTTRPRVVRKTRGPTAGVAKPTKATVVAATKTAPKIIAPPASGESKILVSGLPADVNESQIKEYFAKTIGPVKKVFLTYGPTGQSRGISTIVFAKPQSASEAATQLNGVKVDNRAMKIEVILGADQASATASAKRLGDRIAPTKAVATATKGKNQPKSAVVVATNGKAGKAAAAAGTRPAQRGRGGRAAGRPKRKTAEELDAEMTDYFGGNPATTTVVNGTVATGGDTGMQDEIM